MSNLDRLLAEGAYTCAGSVIRNNVDFGSLSNGELVLTPAGKAFLDKIEGVTDVAVKAPRASKKKAEAVVVDEPTAEDAEAALDALLGE